MINNQIKVRFDCKNIKLKDVNDIIESRLNEVNVNNYGTPMKIIRYRIASDMTVEFQDEYKYQKDATYQNFKKGTIRNPYDKIVSGVGYNGVGKYLPIDEKFGRDIWFAWRQILVRCYSEKHRYKFKAYEDCEVCEEWFCYQNFADWFYKNYYPIKNERIHVDKDILVKGNRVYSSNTCLIVPQRINMIFMEKTNKWNFPSGISLSKTGKYITSYNTKHLGSLDTLEEAISAHDSEKRLHIRQVAEEYKAILSDKVYNALLAW